MPKKRRKKTKLFTKILTILFICGAIGLSSWTLKDLYTMFKLQKQLDRVNEELQALKDENASLISTKEKLEDPDYVQTYARGEYMFSKGDEKVFHLPAANED